MLSERPDPDRLLHDTELSEIQVDVSQEEPEILNIDVMSAWPNLLPKTEMLLEPVDNILCLTLETMGTLKDTAKSDCASDANMETVTDTGANLAEPADNLATKELSEIQELDSAELLKIFSTGD
jgi:phosphoribosyl-dephospho-CoA transferase